MTPLERLQLKIQPLKQQLLTHPLYEKIKSTEDLKIFMQYHVFAVWDFMSLLKSLQQHLTCITLPWRPVSSGNMRFLINEIVTGEESDIDQKGEHISHFELYLQAMQENGASTTEITSFIDTFTQLDRLDFALNQVKVPTAVAHFVRNTFELILKETIISQAAVFTFGREDLIPDLFLSILKRLDVENPGKISIFRYYIERHIEVDGGHHSHLALEMVARLCGSDIKKWETAEQAVVRGLEARLVLWDGIAQEL